jgi:hypothetical protein
MNWTMIGAIGEVLGAIAVVFSLIYLARQVRDSSRQEQRTQYFELNKEAVAFADGIARDPEWANILLRGFQDRSALTSIEIFRFNAGLLGLFRAYEALFLYYKEGGVHEWGAESFRSTMLDIVGMPGVQTYWGDREHWFTNEFRSEVADLIREAVPRMMESYALRSDSG